MEYNYVMYHAVPQCMQWLFIVQESLGIEGCFCIWWWWNLFAITMANLAFPLYILFSSWWDYPLYFMITNFALNIGRHFLNFFLRKSRREWDLRICVFVKKYLREESLKVWEGSRQWEAPGNPPSLSQSAMRLWLVIALPTCRSYKNQKQWINNSLKPNLVLIFFTTYRLVKFQEARCKCTSRLHIECLVFRGDFKFLILNLQL